MFCRQVGRVVARTASAVAQRRAVSSSVPQMVKLMAPSVNYIQTRGSKIEVFGPFDPPKQLTFKQVEERVLKAVRSWDRFPADKEALLKLDADLSKDFGFDSLDQVEIVMALEDEFGFEIPLQDSDKFKTIRDAFKYICEREDVKDNHNKKMVNARILVTDFCHGVIDSMTGIAFIKRIREEEAREVKWEPPAPRERTVLQIRREKQGIFRKAPEPPKKKTSSLKKFGMICVLNLSLLVLWQFLIVSLAFVFGLFERKDWGVFIGHSLIVPIFGASRIVQALWFSDISGACMRAINMPPPTNVPHFSNIIAETLITAINAQFFFVQGILSQYLPIPLVGPVFLFVHMALLNSMYCFDYFFDGFNLTFLRRREIIESHWPYFLGFGTPLTIACSFTSSMFLNGAIFSLLFPFFIISSYKGNWNRKYEERIPQIAFCRISYMLTQLVGKGVKNMTPTQQKYQQPQKKSE
ncbi:unnamed protein product [Caenorhabditis sp. 36 PRJEB53466]|nr:unnamed protein product [Caenorhabditis sp. 36 PRJEB53466]